jgi:capsular polysaccharide export protein
MRVGVFSPGIMRIPHLTAFLAADKIVFRPGAMRRVDAVVGWGRKPNTAPAREYAAANGVPFLALEDGFIRSVGLGVSGDPPLSMVVDDQGIYYDATRPSRLETMLRGDMLRGDTLRGDTLREDTLRQDAIDHVDRARTLISRIRESRISKYNDAPICTLPATDRPRVLVVDQTAGDLSVQLGAAAGQTRADVFASMLRSALDENPDAQIVLKVHPDVIAKKRRGNFGDAMHDPRVRVLGHAANPIALLEQVERVYTVTSLLGFEALMLGKRVTCFGAPFYAGWGVTDDRAAIPARRGRPRTVEEIFAAAYLAYSRYVDPETGERCELERIVDHLTLQRSMREVNRGRSACVGFSIWKQGFLPAFLAGSTVRFHGATPPAPPSTPSGEEEQPERIVVWGTREVDDPREVWRVEDGFLRSVGLGSDLFAPASLAFDRTGIYYDPRTPSDLETILQTSTFDAAQIERARRLRARIVGAGISKYNVGSAKKVGNGASSKLDLRLGHRGGARDNVLVVGQVEDDASIRLGCIDVRTNEALLRAARLAAPNAHLIYKPHPDVVSGNRKDSLPIAVARRMCDEVVIDASLAECLRAAREVHTMTSLVGFEALLRGLTVHVYGQPFYAGWGLTIDRHPHPRRTRKLTVDELVIGALILYPRYVHPSTGHFSTPEAIVEHLIRARANVPSAFQRSWPMKQLRKLTNLAKTLRGSPIARPAASPWSMSHKAARGTKRAPAPRSPKLPDLGCTHALLLQGPAGPFMRRFSDDLRAHGIRVTKVNFHAGEVLYYRGPTAVAFRGRLEDWPEFVRDLITGRGIDAIFLFGDCRPIHKGAITVARELGVKVWVFEEGYLRPDWITLEADGVNGYSKMPRDPEFFRALDLPALPNRVTVGDTFGQNAWYSTLSALAFTHLNKGFPHYVHHRELNAWHHTYRWVRDFFRKRYLRAREAPILPQLEGQLSGRYFFVPLQVHCDFQLVHSPYEHLMEFVDEVLEAFVAHGDPTLSIVFKQHPLDRAYKDWGADFEERRARYRLGDRLIYVHDLHLPTLLKHAVGTITINSTVGLSSVYHDTPVKVMGTAVYDMPGLTHQGSLASFLANPTKPDRQLYENFSRWLLHENQINGTFYKRLPGFSSGIGVIWFPGMPKSDAHRELRT